MGWDEVRRMAASGVTIGAHTVHHTVLTLETPERAGEDFSRGVSGSYSAALTGCAVDDTFGTLGLVLAVEGRRPQRGLRRGNAG